MHDDRHDVLGVLVLGHRKRQRRLSSCDVEERSFGTPETIPDVVRWSSPKPIQTGDLPLIANLGLGLDPRLRELQA